VKEHIFMVVNYKGYVNDMLLWYNIKE